MFVAPFSIFCLFFSWASITAAVFFCTFFLPFSPPSVDNGWIDEEGENEIESREEEKKRAAGV